MAVYSKPYIINLYVPSGSEQNLLEKLHGANVSQPTDKSNFLNRLGRLIAQIGSGTVDMGVQTYPTMYSTWVSAKADFDFAGQPSANDYCQIGARQFIFKASGANASNDEVNIGANLAATMAALVAQINNSSDAITSSYVVAMVKDADSVTVACSKPGRIGNMFAIKKSGTNISVSNDSNGCLTGGVETLPDALGTLNIA